MSSDQDWRPLWTIRYRQASYWALCMWALWPVIIEDVRLNLLMVRSCLNLYPGGEEEACNFFFLAESIKPGPSMLLMPLLMHGSYQQPLEATCWIFCKGLHTALLRTLPLNSMGAGSNPLNQ